MFESGVFSGLSRDQLVYLIYLCICLFGPSCMLVVYLVIMCFATDISINGWVVLWVHGFVVQCDEGKFLFEVADGRGAQGGF